MANRKKSEIKPGASRAIHGPPEKKRPSKGAGKGTKLAGLTSLLPVSEAMGADKSPKEVLQLILKAAHSVTRASTASLMLVEKGTRELKVEAAEGFKDPRIFKTKLPIGQGVTGWVAETGVPLRLGNVTKDDRYIRVQRGLRSELAVPLKIHGRVIGVISVDSTKLKHFSSEDEALLMSLAAQSARVIQTTRLHEETRKRADELRLLIEAGRVLGATLDPSEVLTKLVEMAPEFWRAPLASVYLVSDDRQNFSLAASHGGSEAYRNQGEFSLKGSAIGGFLKGKDETVVSSLSTCRTGAFGEAVLGKRLKTLFAAPLISKDRAFGVLCIFSEKEKSFEKEERRLLAGLARSASLAIENAKVHRKMLDAEEAMRGSEKANLLVEMASGLAHDIRNPLTSIKILNDAMLNGSGLQEEAREDVQMIQKQITRLEQIVDGYLESARSHASVMERKPIDLNAIVDETLLLLATSVEEGTKLSCHLSSKKLNLMGDATQLSQAIYNLVLNAVQAVGQGGKGGKVGRAGRTGRTGSVGKGRGKIEIVTGKLSRPKSGVFFEVADEGPGLAPHVQANLFKPFVTTKSQGVGLGLSIVKRIVQAHGGTITIRSPREKLGHGARFRIELPTGPKF